MANVSLRHVYKIYDGGVTAVTDFNLEIADKEFIILVGPSGCGKSTTLRMIAGLEDISKGELYIGDTLANDVAPKDRDIAMVFQNYALYPHMTVYDNMAFGLKLRKFSKEEIKRRVEEAARILGIEQYLDRKPKALSGGQRQRVALGRAIVRNPKVFLLDEPLSNLDAKLRAQMRTEISKIYQRLGTTFIYVTHDQTEAMTMGTRIVVMKDEFCAAQILVNIVADHNAVFGLDILLFADFFKIFQIRLAATKVFVCCNKFKIVGRNSRPFKSAFCCNKRKNRICCGNKSAAVFLYEINTFLCIRSKACSIFRNDKLVFVIIGKKVIKLFKVGTADFARCFPENFTVCTAVIVLCHSISTCPHRLYKGVGFDFYNRSATLAER